MKSARSAGLAVAGAVFGGAISGGAVWFFLNKMVVINGQGLLARAGWPLGMPILFAVTGAVIGVLSMIRSNRRTHSLREQLAEVARSLGLAYEEGEVEICTDDHPGLPLFERWVRCENRLSGMTDGAAATMLDLTTIHGTGDGATQQIWTVVFFPQTHLAAFACIPKKWSTLAERATLPVISFDPEAADQRTGQAVADFQNAYQLSLRETAAGSDEEEVRRLFRTPRLEAMAAHPGWYVQSADGFLVFARHGIAPASDRPALWHDAAELRRALLAPVAHAAALIPAAPGMDLDRQRSRIAGRRAGGLACAVVGFFGSFIAFATVMASRNGPPAGRLGPLAVSTSMLLAFFSMVPALVVGAIAGSRLGGRIADRFYRPTADGSPPPRISKGWVVAGAFLGWIGGAAIGMALTMVITRHVRAPWFMPIVFFSPPVLGLVLGGFAGCSVARRRAARRSGD